MCSCHPPTWNTTRRIPNSHRRNALRSKLFLFNLKFCIRQPLLRELIDCFPEPVVVLNQTRQIVLANDKMTGLLQKPREELVGSRPAERSMFLSHETDSGCGTGQHCQVCGAVRSVLNCQRTGKPQVEDCNLLCQAGEGTISFDLRIWATPLSVSGEKFIVCAFRDISAENRRRVLERIFFHDALNTAGGLNGVLSLMLNLTPEEFHEMGEMAQECSSNWLKCWNLNVTCRPMNVGI